MNARMNKKIIQKSLNYETMMTKYVYTNTDTYCNIDFQYMETYKAYSNKRRKKYRPKNDYGIQNLI